MKNRIHIAILIILMPFIGYGLDSVIPKNLEVYQTINSIGVEWDIEGDANHNARCSVKYRLKGQSDWSNGFPLCRIDFLGQNMMAGSIMFLDEASEYEIELKLTDIDGGAKNELVTISTRKIPHMPKNGNTYYVVPGDGGGQGTKDDPFLGIVSAESHAQPGDVFILSSGNYGGVIYFKKSGTIDDYIVWRAEEGETPELEGARMNGDFIWLEGITIKDQKYGLRTDPTEPEGIVVKRCYFENCNYSIFLNDGGKDWYIVDNEINGMIGDYSTGDMVGEGVELWHSSGHVVAYNKIYNTADGISYPGRNCDFHHNEIFNVSDDGIEFDYGYSNNRAWMNRITNAYHNGISFQPMNGAPMYVVRNQVMVAMEDGLKLRDNIGTVVLVNNTFVSWRGVQASGAGNLMNFRSNNNLWISMTDRYVWENMSSKTINWRTNLDYDGFDWNDNYYAFKWQGERLQTLEDFQEFSGLEQHAVRVLKDQIFEQLTFHNPPQKSPIQYLTLRNGCNAIDAGIYLNNITGTFSGEAPDLGAFEKGEELPEYGPREPMITHEKVIASTQNLYFYKKSGTGNVVIPGATELKSSNFKIVDAQGHLVYTDISIAVNTCKFNMDMLSHGIYYFIYANEKQYKTLKFVN